MPLGRKQKNGVNHNFVPLRREQNESVSHRFVPLGHKQNNCAGHGFVQLGNEQNGGVGHGFVPLGREQNTGLVPYGGKRNTGFGHDNMQMEESNQFRSTRHTDTKLWQGLIRLLQWQTRYKIVVLRTVPYLIAIRNQTGWLLNYFMMTYRPVWTRPTSN